MSYLGKRRRETEEKIRAAYPGAKRLSVRKAAAFLGVRPDEAEERFAFDGDGKITVESFALALEIERERERKRKEMAVCG